MARMSRSTTSTSTPPRPTPTCARCTSTPSAPFRIASWSRKTAAAARVSRSPYVKDGIKASLVGTPADVINPANAGTKVAVHYMLTLAPAATERVVLRLSHTQHADPLSVATGILATRRAEADEFFASLPGY